MKYSKEYSEGYNAGSACASGYEYDGVNPYPFLDEEETQHRAWWSGWYDALDDAKG